MQKDAEKTYLLFGLIAISVGIYYLLFPFSRDLESDSLTNKIGLTSFIISFAIFPWFIRSYASLKGKTIPTLLSLGMGITLILFLVNNNETKILWWNIFAHILLLSIIAYGFTAIYFQYKRGERNSAIILLVALVIFLLLAIDDIIFVHFRQYYFFNLPETILPFDYFFFFFMIIMGIKLSSDMQRKLLLEKELVFKEKRWSNLLEKVEATRLEQLRMRSESRATQLAKTNGHFADERNRQAAGFAGSGQDIDRLRQAGSTSSRTSSSLPHLPTSRPAPLRGAAF